MAIQYANITKLENNLTDIANIIRTKTNTNAIFLFPDDFITKIEELYEKNDFFRPTSPVGSISTDLLFTSQYDHDTIFKGCTNLTELILTRSQYIPSTICYGATNLTHVQADKAIEIGNNAFNGCSKLGPALAFPSANGQNTYAFNGCKNLEIIDFGGQSSSPWLSANSFYGCTKLSTIILRNTNKFTSISDLNAFTNTPFANGKAGGTIYVPSALIATYQANTNWSTILGYMKSDGVTPQNQILSIEGTIWETTYGDGRLIANVNLAS